MVFIISIYRIPEVAQVETVLYWLRQPAAVRHAIADHGERYIQSKSMGHVLLAPLTAIAQRHSQQVPFPSLLPSSSPFSSPHSTARRDLYEFEIRVFMMMI